MVDRPPWICGWLMSAGNKCWGCWRKAQETSQHSAKIKDGDNKVWMWIKINGRGTALNEIRVDGKNSDDSRILINWALQ